MSNDSVNWDRIAERFQAEMANLIHHEPEKRYGTDFYAEALRRTLGFRPTDENSQERLLRGEGLTTERYARHLYDTSALDRLQRETAEQTAKDARAETRRVYREAGKDFADLLRARCNEVSVPSRYRREGVAWAADLIDPTVPKDQYGNVVQRDGAGEVR
ncbi:hypothetical protein ACTOB_003680 [Actinoplanes oblitus]|uniref:Uncharacterized protein n=1 Tax=Actinoplanes oblitus TaxID=3040509 RepID=A0ABY8WSN3_9ACTN|nr:hypothetical protein [Actinoplanes oblitus]WIN00007.1 hypothetical protein ACTOB_003680 [Actinoplanes oblitus]